MNARKTTTTEWTACHVMKGITQRIINACPAEDTVAMESSVIKIQECAIVVVHTDGMESIATENV